MPAELPDPRNQQERQSERRPMVVRVQYRRTIVRLAAQILDLSQHGLRLAGMERLRIGESVWITLPGLPPRQAKVVWTDRFEAGCVFSEPLHAAVFDAILSGHMH
ncbi:MAG: PilZ domain-containing protein [Novosphingobium sp.]